MMKEIKYRAYSKRTKKVYHVLVIFFYQKVVKLSKTCGSGISFLEQLDDVVLMQYTGIKDKDGVEIYEGDIVRYFGNGLAVIVYRHGGVDIRSLSWRDCEPLQRRMGEIEVIGNIYEHKDLI